MRQLTQFLVLTLIATFFVACQKGDGLMSPENAAPEARAIGPDQQEELSKRKKPVQYTAMLNSLNSSGVSGMATLTVENGELTVEITASGMVPDEPHLQHIHGASENRGNATCPPMSADTNGDGVVSVGEGVPFYGPVLLPLTEFPVADADGNIDYSATFEMSKDLKPLQNRAIVLHGGFGNGSYIISLPVACGQISAPMPIN